MNKNRIITKVIAKISKKPSVEEMVDFLHNPDKKPSWDELKKITTKYKDRWLDAEVIEVNPSKHGKGLDIRVKMKNYLDLPLIIDTDMVKITPLNENIKPKEKVNVKLYFSPGGILVEDIKQLHKYQ